MPRKSPPMNPFLFGKPVGGEHFCNRSKELAELAALYRSANSGWLYSPRRYGKTSLIRESFALVQEKNLFTAYIDLMPVSAGQEAPLLLLEGLGPLLRAMTGGVEQALKALRAFVTSFSPSISLDREGNPFLTMVGARGGPAASPRLEEVVAIPERLAEKQRARVVIALDEFQEIAGVNGLEARLRTAMQNQRRVSYLMAGSQASLLKTIFTSPERPFYQFAHHIPISKIEERELVRYVAGRFAHTGVSISDAAVADLVSLSDRHPHFAQYFASCAWQLKNEGIADSALMGRLVDRVVSSMDPGFRMFFDSLSKSQRRLLVHMSVHGGEALLSEKQRLLGGLGSASTVQTALAALEKKEVLVQEENRWKLVNPAFALWIRDKIALRN